VHVPAGSAGADPVGGMTDGRRHNCAVAIHTRAGRTSSFN
jgi:hypothetical protein